MTKIIDMEAVDRVHGFILMLLNSSPYKTNTFDGIVTWCGVDLRQHVYELMYPPAISAEQALENKAWAIYNKIFNAPAGSMALGPHTYKTDFEAAAMKAIKLAINEANKC